jgi:hypothetical protein
MDLMMYFHSIWSAPLQIALAMYFLWGVVGVSSLAGLAVMILMIPLNGVIAKKSKGLQILQMKQKDARIKEMNEVHQPSLLATSQPTPTTSVYRVGPQRDQSHQVVCLGTPFHCTDRLGLSPQHVHRIYLRDSLTHHHPSARPSWCRSVKLSWLCCFVLATLAPFRNSSGLVPPSWSRWPRLPCTLAWATISLLLMLVSHLAFLKAYG